MLRDDFDRGAADAFARYGLKEAGIRDWPRQAWEGLKESPKAMWHGLTGDPAARMQLAKGHAFDPGGSMHWKNVLWPSSGNALFKWLGRAGTILPALEAYSALRGNTGDPHEGRLTNALGSVGQALGNMYGFPAFGMLGAGALSNVGQRIGKGLGRVLGSKPDAPPPPQAPPVMYYYPGASR